MDTIRFPEEFGRLGGKTFLEVFESEPLADIIEFAATLWSAEKCTGIFEKFKKYVDITLGIESKLSAHEDRSISWVKAHEGEIPSYMLKYVDIRDVNVS